METPIELAWFDSAPAGTTYLEGVLVGQQVHNLERLLQNANGQQLLAVVASLAHQCVGQALHNGAQSLPETLDLVATRRVWEVDLVLGLDGDKVFEGNVTEQQALVRPLSEQLNLTCVRHVEWCLTGATELQTEAGLGVRYGWR